LGVLRMASVSESPACAVRPELPAAIRRRGGMHILRKWLSRHPNLDGGEYRQLWQKLCVSSVARDVEAASAPTLIHVVPKQRQAEFFDAFWEVVTSGHDTLDAEGLQRRAVLARGVCTEAQQILKRDWRVQGTFLRSLALTIRERKATPSSVLASRPKGRKRILSAGTSAVDACAGSLVEPLKMQATRRAKKRRRSQLKSVDVSDLHVAEDGALKTRGVSDVESVSKRRGRKARRVSLSVASAAATGVPQRSLPAPDRHVTFTSRVQIVRFRQQDRVVSSRAREISGSPALKNSSTARPSALRR